MKPKKIAVLTPEENKAWESYFACYVEDGLSDEEADQATWNDLQKDFPRLLEFDGCKP